MNDDIKESPAQSNAPTPALKKSSSVIFKIFAVLTSGGMPILAFVIGLAIVFVLASSVMGDPAKSTLALAGGVYCDDWSATPPGFQQIIEEAAAKFSIQPALLAGIYKQENGQNWHEDRWSGEQPWPVSPAPDFAAGPFQFIPPTWKGEIAKSVVKERCGNLTEADVNQKEKAACVAAYYLSDKLVNSGITNDTMTEQEQDIKDVAVAYSSSSPYFNNWRQSGRDESALNPRYKEYHDNVWATFQDLNQGCQSYTASSIDSNDIVQIALNESTKTWDEYHVGGQIEHSIYLPQGGRWCAAFVVWVYSQAGLLKSEGKLMSTINLKDHFEAQRNLYKTTNADPNGPIRSVNDIHPGDIVWFSRAVTRGDDWRHVAIVRAVYDDGSVSTIEGNTGGNLDALSVYDKPGAQKELLIDGEYKQISRPVGEPRRFSDILAVGRVGN